MGTDNAAKTALVLGGGGVTGIAWEIGVLVGLVEAGVDLTSADLVVGTSAGSVVGALVAAGEDPEKLYESQLEDPSNEITAALGRGLIARYAWAAVTTRNVQRFGAKLGRLALAAKTVSEEERRAVIAARLPLTEWPDRRLVVTAIDAKTGEFVAFDRGRGVPLFDAVAASCSVPGVWPPTTVGGRQYIDGGMRSPANVDLAAGYGRVVVLAPLTRGFGPMLSVARQIALLGPEARTAVVAPDAATTAAIGRNVLDPAARAPSARAGRIQAASVVEQVRAVWTDENQR
jgi:NTE family protein